MRNIVSLQMKPSDKNPVCKEQLLELVDYLFSLEKGHFTGQLEIGFELGAINQVAFNQKATGCFDLTVNE